MDNINTNLNTLSKCKSDIKNAIEQHNIVVDVPLTGYADKIRSISITSVPCVFYPGTKFKNSTFESSPVFNTSEFTDMSHMFENCVNLKNIYTYSTSNVTNMSHMFSGCTNLISIPELDTNNVTDMNGMFENCVNLTTIPELDTSNVIAFGNKTTDKSGYPSTNGMFAGCSNLTQIPKLNTTNGQYFSYMFFGCVNLTTIPELDTSNAIVIDRIFYDCSSLESLPLIDCSSLEIIILDSWNKYETPPTKYIVKGCTNLTHVGGFKNLGRSYPSIRDENGSWLTFDILDLSSCTKLTTESLNNIINNLYDRVAAKYEGSLRIIWSKDSFDKLTTTMKNKLNNKGYTFTYQ